MTQDRTTIDDIKARHPIAEVATRYVSNLRRAGGWLIGSCPFHDDRDPSFGVSLNTETWQCFAASCGLGGDVIDLIGYARCGRAWNSRDKEMFKEVLSILEGGRLPPPRRTIPAAWRNAAEWRPVELTPHVQILLHMAARLYHTNLLAMGQEPGTPYAYLRGRGLADATIRREGMGYATGDLLGPALAACGLSRAEAADVNLLDRERHHREFMAGRIVFVECDRSGRVLHLIGRKFAPWLSEAAPKYLSLKDIFKPLYGYARLDKRPSKSPVILVESPPDAITARQWGFDALANTGTRMKEEHVRRLARLQRPLIIVPHNDDGPGWEAAERWKAMIGHGTLVPLPTGVKDLNELGATPDGESVFAAQLRMFGLEGKAGEALRKPVQSGQ
jgi:DNA primase